MRVIIDLSSRQAITDFGNSTPAPIYVVKSQDTVALNIYFVQEGIAQDLGAAAVFKFGLIQSGMSTLLVLDTVFSRLIDENGNVYYQGFPVFNTSALLTALGSSLSISCTGEIRYQQPDGEIVHSLDIPFTVNRTILSETTTTTTTASFTQPAVGSTVPIAVVTTSFLSVGDVVSIGTAGDTYTITAVTDGAHFTGENMGTGTTVPGSTMASGTTVSLASPNVLATYPDVSTIELKIHKDQPCGYAGLTCAGSGYISNVHVLVDGNTITNTDPAGLASANKLTVLSVSFVQPAASDTVVATVGSSALLVVNAAVYIDDGGFYIVTAIAGTSVTLQNNGDAFNVAAGTTVPSGAALVPAQAVSGGGIPGTNGVNAYTTTSANFTVPAAGSSVNVIVGATSWMGALGQVLYIQGAGYYSIAGVIDPSHVSLSNLGYPGNATAGSTIPSGSIVTPGGLQGPAGAGGNVGQNAYDKTTASFTMPAANGTVNITIGSTTWLAVGQILYITTAGFLSVNSITNPTTFVATNVNYTGNAAAATTIVANSAVSPGGIIGPTGSGGAGKDAFTTLTNSFTQPAVNATVPVVVGKTAFMAVGEVLFVQSGGYYTVSAITDAVTVVLNNLGYIGNAGPGATVSASGGNVPVVPSGLAGVAGTNAYTTTVASFTMPVNNATVTVSVAATAWMAQGQILYIPAAGYFSVSVINDPTHVVLTNLGYSGNASSGTTIASGSPVAPAGIQGSAGSGGGGGGGVSSLTDATTTGTSWITSPTGVLKRVVQGSNITLTDSGTSVTIAASSTGGGTAADIFQGVYFQDDFTSILNITGNQGWQTNTGASGSPIVKTTYGQDATRKFFGSLEFPCGTGTSGNNGSGLCIGQSNGQPAISGEFLPGIGTMTFKYRVAINGATPPVMGNTYVLRVGLMGFAGAYTLNSTLIQRAFFEYSPDNNSGQWRVGVGTTSTTYTNTTSGFSVDTAYDLQIDVNAANTQYTFTINATVVATITTGLPSGAMYSVIQHTRDTGLGNNYRLELDAVSGLIQVAR